MDFVLKVGEKAVTIEDLYPLLKKYNLFGQLAKEMIIDMAISQIECSAEEIDRAKRQFYQQNQITNEEQLKGWLKQNLMTEEELQNLATRPLKLEKFKQTTWGNKLESYFLKYKSRLDRVVYSLIRTKDAGIAQELYFRIQEGESSFADLARKYSNGPEAETGGLIGPVELHVPHPQMAQMLLSSKPGQLWPPVLIGEWLVIVRLENLFLHS